MRIFDFECENCGLKKEELLIKNEVIPCPKCAYKMTKLMPAPKIFNTIQVTHNKSKKLKAGYVHSHGDKEATKIQSGYGGCQGPRH